MPRNPTRSAPFAKVRVDHATETAEDYVEAVDDILRDRGECRVRDLAKHMGVSHVTVTRIVSRLQDQGLLRQDPYQQVHLTPEGEQIAAQSRCRHEIVLQFLLALGVPPEAARHDAEGIEHHVGKATLRCMKKFIDDHPEEDNG